MKVNSGFAKGSDESAVAHFGNRRMTVNPGWFRGNNPRFRPVKPAMLSPEAIKSFILDGWTPPGPVISKNTRVLAFGGLCFAGNIAKHLEKAGFNLLSDGPREDGVFTIGCDEGIVNTFTMRQLMEWVYEGKQPIEPLWRDADSLYAFEDRHRARMRATFDSAEVFIVTLGLSEVWYDKQTGNVFSSNIPRKLYDKSKHGSGSLPSRRE